ncbi:(2Fe-2S)-binding protein [Flexilinea flocculi]|jgi:carbon-monoxide dehydrogenase small subunit|uniref:Aerobic-type carbon monoxide dehydrogenase, small subunit, CoxS/CutS family n=1 Tax=Flexilinea flocculi TaxID=1678840 RepID=A0A0K8PAI7_9CHLR|nr:(2Fe-2S)-binding protein [Flexilinea flocculi]NMB93580.1 (2Fe-2S)-binding protein [Flexilinea flocculi]GAP39663.1 aerobic-type carbon monoxide dehydrogenase, small subunit, CoxS/CutS family [Flexilinea flocculi]
MNGQIHFTLNGEKVTSDRHANERLLDVLREDFKLTGVKCGCKEGECGACSVLLNGVLANSCMVAMGSIEGSEVVTIEGYSKTKRFQALSDAYAQTSAVQCGFCIPGMVLACEALLAKNPNPTDAEIRKGISGNLCRCTGYNAIVEAVKIAAREGKGLW